MLAHGDWCYENNERGIRLEFKMFTNDGDRWNKCSDWGISNIFEIECGDEDEGAYLLPGINDLKNKWILKKYTEGS